MTPTSAMIFERWESGLVKKDKVRMEPDFQALFHSLAKAKIPRDEAYPYVERAIRSYTPTPAVIKAVYRRVKLEHPMEGRAEQDFADSWRSFIKQAAVRSFYVFYPEDETEITPVQTGGMSPAEYALQRRRADSYPELSKEAVEERMRAVAAAAFGGDL